MKHNNVIYLDNMLWNWSRSVVCDNAIFVASCINKALADEVKWPFGAERRVLGAHIPQLKGCISCVHGTLVQIRHSYKNEHHTRWYHGRKIMYCMNNTILVDHDGLFIFVDGGYPGSFHDMTILKNSWVEMHWWDLFTNNNDYCEFVLGDQGYTRLKKYIMCGFSKVEMRCMDLPPGLAKTFNKMHVGYRVRVEWGVRGLKMKWHHLMKQFDLVKPKFSITYRAATLMTNFLHRRCRNMQEVVDGPR